MNMNVCVLDVYRSTGDVLLFTEPR